jgi:predicted NBD/HSP70 family sugar kinase
MSLESYLYEQELDKVIAQRNELAELLSDVLDAWAEQVAFAIDNYTLYVKATDYLKGLRYE